MNISMNIASMSMNLSQYKVQQQAQTGMMKKALDNYKQSFELLAEGLENTNPQIKTTPSHLGNNFNKLV